jgi:RNA polymerase sigma-70 factor (ECF subfamily)
MTLRHLEGLSNPDVAQIMQISVEAVESLMSRGKRSLAHALAPQKKALGLEDDG